MSRKKLNERLLTGLACIAGFLLLFAVLVILYFQNRYLSYFLTGVGALSFGVVELVLALFGREFLSKLLPGKASRILEWVAFILFLGVAVFWFTLGAFFGVSRDKVTYGEFVVVVTLLIVSIILYKLTKHVKTEDTFLITLLKNAKSFYAVMIILIVLTAVSDVFCLLNVFHIHKYVNYVITGRYYAVVLMTLISFVVRAIRRELTTRPRIVIWPFGTKEDDDLSVVGFLEKNTGITVRNLWSLKYIRKVLPAAVVILVALFWLSTGIVFVNSSEKAVVYRFGKLLDKTLEPGLHFVLPYPVDRAEVCDTEKVRSVTIGYSAADNVKNVWTEDHGGSEYKLLLGSGKELISMNLRVEYKIDDVKEFFTAASDPEKILEAHAYELATSRTIGSDLKTMLSVDREAFSARFREDLAGIVDRSETGISVVSVILESIHPPVEVAKTYQEFIAVGIDAERIVTEAKGKAEVRLIEAEKERNGMIAESNASRSKKLATARSGVSDFMAAVTAYKSAPEAYAYYKYLASLSEAYRIADLVILGAGVDGTRLYWGNLLKDAE